MKHQTTRLTHTAMAMTGLVIVTAAVLSAQLPNSGMEIDPSNTALLITDPPERLPQSGRGDVGCGWREC